MIAIVYEEITFVPSFIIGSFITNIPMVYDLNGVNPINKGPTNAFRGLD